MIKKIFFGSALMLSVASSAIAYDINGRYFSLKDCKYEYNRDFGQSGYVGVYRGPSGEMYSWFFPSDQYMWCPN